MLPAPQSPTRDLAAIADELDEFHRATGDDRARRAARVLRSRPRGRPADPDEAAVAEAVWLIDSGRASSLSEAARAVAENVGGNSAEAIVRRLRRKIALGRLAKNRAI